MKRMIAAVLALVMICACSPAVNSSEVKELLSLGEQYLLELDYQQALAQFLKVIEVEPRSADAYLGAARAYAGLGDAEGAVDILRQGLERTGDQRIREALAAQLALPHLIRSITDEGGLSLTYGQEDLEGRLQGFCIINEYDAGGKLIGVREGTFVDDKLNGSDKCFWYNPEKNEYGFGLGDYVDGKRNGYQQIDCYASAHYDEPEDGALVRFEGITGADRVYAYYGNMVDDLDEDDSGRAYQMWRDSRGYTVEYIGCFKNGHRHGPGRMWSSEGWSREGNWAEGEYLREGSEG